MNSGNSIIYDLDEVEKRQEQQSESKIDDEKRFHQHYLDIISRNQNIISISDYSDSDDVSDAEPTTCSDALYCVSLNHQEAMYFGPLIHATENLVVCVDETQLVKNLLMIRRNDQIMKLINKNNNSTSKNKKNAEGSNSMMMTMMENSVPNSFISTFLLAEAMKPNEWYESFSTPYSK